MDDLLWFSGITLDTPLQDIGWTYVLVLGLSVAAFYYVTKALHGE